jgi:LPXTG-motif cell wall-anchored protein
MKCIDYDDPSGDYPGGFPNPIAGTALPEVFVDGPQEVTFGPTTLGTGAGTFYAKGFTLGPIVPGDGFEIACQAILPPGEYSFTNVFRMVASPVNDGPEDVELFRASGPRGTAVVVPMVDAVSGAIDLTAKAGVKAGDPIDPVTPTPTPTPTPTEPGSPTPTPTVTPTGSDNPGPLPQTGGNAGTLAALGAAGLLAGILLMILGGRRRTEDTAGGHI